MSDYEVELLATDRLSFRYFLEHLEKIPERSTIWLFRENLMNKGKIHHIWDELQRQLDEQGYSIKRGTIQDASFITSDPFHANVDTPRGDAATTRRSLNGTWARKGKKSQFRYNLHSLIDKEYQFVRRSNTSTASFHDRQIDLSQKGETVYRDKGYFGTIPYASIDKTMKRTNWGKQISTKDKRRNRSISRTRSLVERPFAVIKWGFHVGHMMVTTHPRVNAKNLFTCFSYNLFNLVTVQKIIRSSDISQKKENLKESRPKASAVLIHF